MSPLPTRKQCGLACGGAGILLTEHAYVRHKRVLKVKLLKWTHFQHQRHLPSTSNLRPRFGSRAQKSAVSGTFLPHSQ
jgi:hypothetical protein